ncbi:MAG: TauD/TfdA family dioxygenase [Deltaproteobacteria bacterium]|nr:TauD/TfdA family dioxygenase [Deltaproteobacteria bacterium]
MRSTPLAEKIGAQVHDLDLAKPLSDSDVSDLRRLWTRRGVLRFRGQRLDDEQLMSFSRLFGELDHAPMGLATSEQRARLRNPFVTSISNIVEGGRPIGGLGAYEAQWHCDMAYQPEPATGSVLYAVEVPESGGDTSFTSMRGAYEVLPDELKRRVVRLTLKHDASHTSVGGLRPGYDESPDPREAPGAVHPLVVLHPDTREPALLLGRRQLAYVPTLSLEDSEALLDELWSYVARPDDTWTQEWRVGDVLMWDNRSVMHHRNAFDPQARRLMRRTQLKGAPPIAADVAA